MAVSALPCDSEIGYSMSRVVVEPVVAVAKRVAAATVLRAVEV